MRANVLNDAALLKHAGQFAWLSIDTEKAQNESFLEKFPVESWPTFFIIDSAGETVALKWAGSADVQQLEKLFEDGEVAIRMSGGKSAEETLALADRANGAGHKPEAVKLYRDALQRAPDGWARRPRTIQSLMIALREAGSLEECVQTALKDLPTLPRDAAFANTAAEGLQCAVSAPTAAAWRRQSIVSLESSVRTALAIPELMADDRSSLYEFLVSTAEADDDKARAKQLASEWLAFLDTETAKASTPEARSAFDSHRLAAASKLGDPARVIPALQASERDLPHDYNPPLQLATAYSQLGRYQEALKAVDRALSKVYGPRRLRVLTSKANIYLKMGDAQSARRILLEALRFAESIPKAQRSERAIERVRALLDEARTASSAKAR